MRKFISILLSCLIIISVFCAAGASAQSNKVYYLFGYINGADYACESDFENMGEYRFENGELEARFDVMSYVAVKEENNANWYMTDGWMGDVKSARLYNTNITAENSNKLKVPAGVTVKFKLEENGDDTLTLSYTVDGDENYPIRAELWDYVNIYIKEIISSTGNYYTEETEKPFLQALKAANEALDNQNATDEELVSAYNNLKTAEKNLKKQDLDYWKAKLSTLTSEYSVDFENIDLQYEIYTKESFDKYLAAYRSANSSLGDSELFWFDLSEKYYTLKNARNALVRLDGTDNPNPDKKLYLTDEFKTLLSAYGKEIGIGADVMDESGVPASRTIDGKEVVEYRGLRIFNTSDNFMVFGLSDMLCTVGEETIGEYRFNNPLFCGTEKNKSGLCVYYNGKIYSIKDAVDLKIETVEKLAEIIPFTEKGEKIYPTIAVSTSAETTAPIPTKPENRPTMPIIIIDTGSGRYEIADNPQVEVEGTTAASSTNKSTENEGEYLPVSEPTTEPAETNTTAPKEATESEWDGEFITTEPTSVSSTEPSETQTVTRTNTDKPAEPKEAKAITAKKSNPLKITSSIKIIKTKKLKKSKVTFKALDVKNAQGKVTYKLNKNGSTAKLFKKAKINSNGVITIKKGKLKKGIYKLRVSVTAKGNKLYKSAKKHLTIRIKIK